MASITATLSARINGNGKSEILLRFVGNRDMVFRLKSGIFIPANRWDKKRGRITLPRTDTMERAALVRAEKQFDELCRHLIEVFVGADKKQVTKEWIQKEAEYFLHPERRNIDKSEDILPHLHTFMEMRDTTATKASYNVLYNLLQHYGLYRGKKLTFAAMTVEELYMFADYMAHEHIIRNMPEYAHIYKDAPRGKSRSWGKNSIYAQLALLRTFMRWAATMELTDNNPFTKFRMPGQVYGTPYYLTLEERKRLQRCDLHNHPLLAQQRDIFVFQCLIGCRVSDLMQLRKSNVIRGAIEYIPRKTKEDRTVTVRVPLNETAKEILARYADTEGSALLPCVTTTNYNRHIKKIFQAARLTRMVTVINPVTRKEEQRRLCDIASSHLARRTFIGNLYKQVKDPNLVGALSGHKEGSKAFARYRTIDDDMKTELVSLLE